jgi:hypothetical protein
MDNTEYNFSDFDYAGADPEDIEELFIHKENILSQLPFEMQIDLTCFKKTFCNLYHYYKQNENHEAHLLDDLFFEEFVLASTDKVFKNNNQRELMNEIKNKTILIE